MKKSFGIQGKILAIGIILSVFTAVVGGIGVFGAKKIAEKYDSVASTNLPTIKLLGDMVNVQRRFRIDILNIAMPGASAEKIAQTIDDAYQQIPKYEGMEKSFREIPFGPGEADLFRDLSDSWGKVRDIGTKILALAKSSSPQDRAKMNELILGDFAETAEFYGPANKKLLAYTDASAKRSVSEAKVAAEWCDRLVFGALLISVIVSVGASLLFSRALARALSEVARSLSGGADEVASASSQVAAASESLSSGATEQAAAIQETAASIEQISATIKKNAENSKRSAEISDSSQTAALQGNEIVSEVIQTISEISRSNEEVTKQVEESNREIAEIIKVIGDIGTKTKVINDIVFQTKLLSFNASVEAARAGEHGKGFAVVAEEVGSLAQMSGNAAREITSMLDESISRVETIVNRSREKVGHLVVQSREKIEKGTEVAKKCGDVLGGLVENVKSVNQMVSEIAQASQEQANGVTEINHAVSQLDQMTQQNAAVSQQTSGASAELSGQADAVRASVRKLLEVVNGDAGKLASHSKQIARKAPLSKPKTAARKSADPKPLAESEPSPKITAKARAEKPARTQPLAGRMDAQQAVPDESDSRFKAA